MNFAIDTAVVQWEEGYRSIEAARSGGRDSRALGRAVVAVQEELRRRLGSTFTVAELASLYREGSDWAPDRQLRGRRRRLLSVHARGFGLRRRHSQGGGLVRKFRYSARRIVIASGSTLTVTSR